MQIHTKIAIFTPMEKRWSIKWHDVIDSTNLEAERWLPEAPDGDFDTLSVIAAKWQTAGRGQGDHKWHSAPGENLTFTVVERYGNDGPEASGQVRSSWGTALAIVDYLESHGIEAKIKLPNDIYVGDNKICGLLIKHDVRAGKLIDSIIGIGLDINETDFPADLPNPTSLRIEKAGKLSASPSAVPPAELEEELEKLMGMLSKRLDLSVSLQALEKEFYTRLR